MNIIEFSPDFDYNPNNTYICSLDVLGNPDELAQIPLLDIITEIAKRDKANLSDSRISFCPTDETITKCFVCLKKENIDNKENGIKIASVGYSSLSAIQDMLLQIALDNSLETNPYSYLWFEKTQEPFIQTDFISLGFNNIFDNVWIKHLPTKVEIKNYGKNI